MHFTGRQLCQYCFAFLLKRDLLYMVHFLPNMDSNICHCRLILLFFTPFIKFVSVIILTGSTCLRILLICNDVMTPSDVTS